MRPNELEISTGLFLHKQYEATMAQPVGLAISMVNIHITLINLCPAYEYQFAAEL